MLCSAHKTKLIRVFSLIRDKDIKGNHLEYLNSPLIEQYQDVLGPEVFNETVELYKEQAQKYIQQLKQSLQQEDRKEWQEGCHILKSASGNIGLQAVFTVVGELEYSGESFAELGSKLQSLIELNESSLEFLTKKLTQ